MSWHYDDTAPFSTNKDHVRTLIGDTDTTDQLISDETIFGALDSESDDVYYAAASVCEILAAKYARQVNTSANGLSVSAGARASNYQKLAETLRAKPSKSARKSATMKVYGSTYSDRSDMASDSDVIKPMFTRNKFKTASEQYSEEDNP